MHMERGSKAVRPHLLRVGPRWLRRQRGREVRKEVAEGDGCPVAVLAHGGCGRLIQLGHVGIPAGDAVRNCARETQGYRCGLSAIHARGGTPTHASPTRTRSEKLDAPGRWREHLSEEE